jgi:iron complex transport system ATP-binding protein
VLEVDNIFFQYGTSPVLKGLSFCMEKGEFVCILGSNGCGKTTLLRTVMGFLRPQSGRVLLDGKDVHKMDEKKLARLVAYIPQAHVPPFSFSVMDVVMMGRTPHMSRGFRPSAHDREIAEDAMISLGLQEYASRDYTELSGGQRQLVIIARALAQQPKLLVMDEPTASLDYGNQYLVLAQVLKLSRLGMGVLMVTHDPAHAVFCADRVIAMRDGRIVESGGIADVITEPVMRDIYNMDIKVRKVSLSDTKDRMVFIPDP